MIASHDTYTYLEATNPIYNLFTGLWKCLDKILVSQDVLYYDIRVHKVPGGWQVCHGLVDLPYTFETLTDICNKFELLGYYRIVLEKGDASVFREEVAKLKYLFTHFDLAIIKSSWEILFDKYRFRIVDYTNKANSLKEIWTWFKNDFLSIKRHAKKNNPEITKEMKEDMNVVYYFDFV